MSRNTEQSSRSSPIEDVTLNVAVIGKSGCGKSTFINTYCGLSPGSPESAKRDVVECTKEIKAYFRRVQHDSDLGSDMSAMGNVNYIFVLWDLPGFGTPTFPENQYIKDMNLEKYDFFLLMSCTRFVQFELALHNFIAQQGKKYFYVRTKIDNDIRNDRGAHPRTSSEEKVKKSVRDDIQKNISTKPNIFLVNAKDRTAYDFPRLESQLVRFASSSYISRPLTTTYITLNVAVIGKSGCGKSTFINSYCGLTPGSPESAKTGVIEGTKEIKPYSRSMQLVSDVERGLSAMRNANYTVILWDLPGFGTEAFPEDQYIKDIKLEKYDFFLLMSCTGFVEFEIELHNFIAQQGKTYFYVRTKIDNDIQNHRRAHPGTSLDKKVKERVRDGIQRYISTEPNIFLVNAKDRTSYDFPQLESVLVFFASSSKSDWRKLKLVPSRKRRCVIS